MHRHFSRGLLAVLLLAAAPALAQDREPAPPAGEGSGRTDAPPAGPGTGRAEAPAPGAGTGRTDAPEARLEGLERRLAEQQKEIESLKREREARDLKKGPAIDEKGAVKEAGAKKPEAPQFEWGYRDGFFVKGDIHEQPFELRPVARLQLDYRAFPHSSKNDAYATVPPQDEFLIRRARAGFVGTFSVFGFDFELDPTRNSASQIPLGDFWLQYQQLPELNIRFGQFKAPVTLEDGMTSDNYLEVLERSMMGGSGSQLAPDFHPGVEVWGTWGADKFAPAAKYGHGLFQYYLAVQNQPQNNSPLTGDPLTSARLASEVAESLVVGVDGRWENRQGIPADPKTAPSGTQLSFAGVTPGQFQWFSPVQVRGWMQAYTVDVSYYGGPFFLKGEYGYSSFERWRVLADHSNGTALIEQGAVITGGWMFWGPSGNCEHPLFPFKGWELLNMDALYKRNARNVGMSLVARVEYFDVGEARGGRKGQGATPAVPSTAVNADKVKGNDCRDVTVGLNLYPIENVRIGCDWVHLRIGDQSRSEKAHSRFADEFLMRAQLEF